MSHTAVITGVTGQVGFYLADYLLKKNYRVIGIDRRTSMPTDERLAPLRKNPSFSTVCGDITDLTSIRNIVEQYKPHEFYNLAAQSHVGLSWNIPVNTADITGFGVLNCLEAIRQVQPRCRFYQASSSEMFGNSIGRDTRGVSVDNNGTTMHCKHLNEDSFMLPESPYAAAKLFGHHITRVYRRSYDMFAACGILFNTESPLRGENFVTRHITKSLALIKHGLADKVKLGNVNACRDWGFAGDAVRAMHMILNANEPDDYVIATGKTESVRNFLDLACQWFGFDPEDVLEVDESRMRPKDVEVLLGDSSKINKQLGWIPTTQLNDIVNIMCDHDFYYYHPDPAQKARAVDHLWPTLGG